MESWDQVMPDGNSLWGQDGSWNNHNRDFPAGAVCYSLEAPSWSWKLWGCSINVQEADSQKGGGALGGQEMEGNEW